MSKLVEREDPSIAEGGNKVKKVTKKPKLINSWMWFGATVILGLTLAAIIIALA